MAADIVVAKDVVKTYRSGVGRARVREMTPPPIDRAFGRTFPNWWQRDTFNALDHVSLEVKRGTALGLIGHNGAGKTTLLQLICGVSAPTSGAIATSGRVAAILDVTVGFHPELTGRENLFLVGNMYGLSRREVLDRQERILDFAELGALIDTPVKRYSAGMVARLGFATLASVEADVLLIDEVLAVGDASFQRKCIKWLDEFRGRGGTLIFVSHNLGLIRHMTERVLWLHHGQVRSEGTTGRVLLEYGKDVEEHREGMVGAGHGAARNAMRATGVDRWGAGGIRVSDARLLQSSLTAQATLEVEIHYDVRPGVVAAHFAVGLIDEMGFQLGASLSPRMALDGEEGTVRWRLNHLPLRTGVYFPVVIAFSPTGVVLDRWKLDRPFVVETDDAIQAGTELGPTDLGGEWWDVEGESPTAKVSSTELG